MPVDFFPETANEAQDFLLREVHIILNVACEQYYGSLIVIFYIEVWRA